MDKQNAAHPYNGTYSALKRSEVLVPAAMWMDFGNIRTCGRNYLWYDFYLYEIYRIGKSIETEKLGAT